MIIKTSDGNNDNNNHHHHHHHARVRATKEGGVSVCSCDPGSVWVTQDAHLLRFTTSTSSRKRHPATLVPTQGEGGGRHRRWIPSTRLPAPPPPTHTHPIRPLPPPPFPSHTHTHTPSSSCFGYHRLCWAGSHWFIVGCLSRRKPSPRRSEEDQEEVWWREVGGGRELAIRCCGSAGAVVVGGGVGGGGGCSVHMTRRRKKCVGGWGSWELGLMVPHLFTALALDRGSNAAAAAAAAAAVHRFLRSEVIRAWENDNQVCGHPPHTFVRWRCSVSVICTFSLSLSLSTINSWEQR